MKIYNNIKRLGKLAAWQCRNYMNVHCYISRIFVRVYTIIYYIILYLCMMCCEIEIYMLRLPTRHLTEPKATCYPRIHLTGRFFFNWGMIPKSSKIIQNRSCLAGETTNSGEPNFEEHPFVGNGGVSKNMTLSNHRAIHKLTRRQGRFASSLACWSCTVNLGIEAVEWMNECSATKCHAVVHAM